MEAKKQYHCLNIAIAVVAICSVLFFTAVYMDSIYIAVKEDALSGVHESEKQNAAIVREHFDNSLKFVENLALSLGKKTSQINSPDAISFIKEMNKYADYGTIAAADLNGKLYFPDRSDGGNIAHNNYFQKAIAGEPNISDVYESVADGRKLVSISARVMHNDTVIGVITVRYYYEDRLNSLVTFDILEGRGYCYLVQPEGTVLARSNHLQIAREIKNIFEPFKQNNAYAKIKSRSQQKMLEDMQYGRSGETLYRWKNGTDRIMSYIPVGINGWYMVTSVPEDFIASRSLEFIFKAIVFLMAVLFIFIAVIAYVFRILRSNMHILEKAHKNLSLLYDTTPGGIVRCRYDGSHWVVTSANEEFYRFIGYSRSEFEKKFNNKPMGIIAAPLIESIRAETMRQLSTRGKLEMKVPLVSADGSLKWVLLKGKHVESENGEDEFFCVFLDITSGDELNKELFVSKEQLDILRNMPDIIFFEWDINTKIISNSSNFAVIFDVPNIYENFPESAKAFNFVHPDDFEGFMHSFEDMKNGRNNLVFELRLIHKDGSCVWYKSSLHTIFDYNAVPIKVVGIMSNIDYEKRKLETAEELAKRDPLTRLYNNLTTKMLVQQYIDSSQAPGAFIMVDIDNFKGINDTLGHIYGDAVLSELAHTLASHFRDSDITGRIGGDEFVVFMTNLHSKEIVQKKAGEILKALRRSFNKGKLSYHISCSIGISMYPEQGKNFGELMEKADGALYYAKNHGKNQYVINNETVENESKMNIENDKLVQKQPMTLQKNFRENMAEYILKLFYEFDDVDTAVPVLLDFVGKSYNIGRIDVSIFTENDKYYQPLYEWCNDGIESVKGLGEEFLADEWETIKNELDEYNIICCENVADAPLWCFENDNMKERGVKSIMLCYAIEHGTRKAVLAFEYFGEEHHFTLEERDTMKTISSTISLFILRSRERQKTIEAAAQKKNREALLDESDEVVYVSDPETYELYYVNKAAREAFNLNDKDYSDKKCYDFLAGRNEPCPYCTNHLLTADKFYIWENESSKTKHHYLLKDKLIEWNGKEARIEWAIDLTEKENYVNALSLRLKVKNSLLEGVEEMVSASSLEESMGFVLKRIGEIYRADRSYILELDEKAKMINMTYEWAAEGVSEQIKNMHNFKLKKSPVWNEAFRSRKPLFMEDLSILKADHPEEYERLAAQKIISIYAVPFSICGNFCGFLGIDSPREYKGDTEALESMSYFVADEIFKRRTLNKSK